MPIKKIPQLDLFPNGDVAQKKAERFIEDVEKHLNNIKYIYTQIRLGQVEEDARDNALKALRDAQIALTSLAARVNIEYKIFKEHNYNWYYDVFIQERKYVYTASPIGQQDLYEMVKYQLNRLRTTFYAYRENWQHFCPEYVKAMEENMKLTYLALK